MYISIDFGGRPFSTVVCPTAVLYRRCPLATQDLWVLLGFEVEAKTWAVPVEHYCGHLVVKLSRLSQIQQRLADYGASLLSAYYKYFEAISWNFWKVITHY